VYVFILSFLLFYRELLKLFLCKELINFDALNQLYGKELLTLNVFNKETAHGQKSWEELKNRLIEHVSLKRLPLIRRKV
jgi:26S proteasome regulatory subunit N5